MTTRTRELYPARMIGSELVGMPGIFASTGADPLNGISSGWMRQLVTDLEHYLRANGATQDEIDSIRWYGAEHLRASYVDVLTADEQMRDDLRQMLFEREQMRQMFLSDGTLRPGADKELRALLGI